MAQKNELQGSLAVDASGFLNGISGALQKGAQQVAQWISGAGRAALSIVADAGPLSSVLSAAAEKIRSLREEAHHPVDIPVDVDTSGLASGFNQALSEIRGRVAEGRAALASLAANGDLGSAQFEALAAAVRDDIDEMQRLQTASKQVDAALGETGGHAGETGEGLNQVGQHASEAGAHAEEAHGPFGKLKELFSEGLATGVAILGVQGLGQAIEGSFEKFEVQEKAEIGLEAAFRGTGKAAEEQVESLKKFAAARQQVTTFGDEETLKVLQFGKTLGGITDPAKLQAFAVAVQDVATATGQSLDAVSLGLASKLEAGGKDRKLGITFEAGETEKNINLFIAAAKSKFQNLAEDIGKTPAAGVAKFKNAFGDLQEVLGKLIIGIIGPIVPVLQQLVELFQSALAPLGEIIGKAFAPLGQILAAVLGPIGKILAPLGGIVEKALAPVSAIMLKALAPLQDLLGSLGEPLGKLVALVGNVAAVLLGAFGKVAQTAIPLFARALVPIVSAISGVVDALQPVITLLGDLLAQIIPVVIEFQPWFIVLQALGPLLRSLVPSVLAIVVSLAQVATTLLSALMPAFNAILPLISVVVNLVLGTLVGALATVIEWVARLAATLVGLLADGLTLLIDGIVIAVKWIVSAGETVGRALMPALTVLWDILKGIGGFLGSILVPVFEGLWTAIKAVVGVLAAPFVDGLEAVWNALRAVYNAIVDFISTSTIMKNVIAFVTDAWNKLVLDFKAAIAIIRDIIDGWNAFKTAAVNAITSLLNFDIKGFFDNIIGGLRSAHAEAERLRQAEQEAQTRLQGAAVRIYNDLLKEIPAPFSHAATVADIDGVVQLLISRFQDLEEQSRKSLGEDNSKPFIQAYEALIVKVKMYGEERKKALEGKPADTPPPPPPPNSVKDKYADFYGEIAKMAAEAANIVRELGAKTTANELARIAAEADAKKSAADQEAKDRATEFDKKIREQKEQLEKTQRLVFRDAEGNATTEAKVRADFQAASDKLLAAKKEQARLDELKAIREFVLRSGEEELKLRIDVLKEQEEAIFGEDVDAIRRRGELHRQQTELQLNADLQAIIRKKPEFAATFAEIDKLLITNDIDANGYAKKVADVLAAAVPKIVDLQSGLASLGKKLLDATIKPHDYFDLVDKAVKEAIAAAGITDPEIVAAINKGVVQAEKDVLGERKALRDADIKDRIAMLALVSDADERALAQQLVNAHKAQQEELDLLDEVEIAIRRLLAVTTDKTKIEELNRQLLQITEARIQTETDLEVALYDLRVAYLEKYNAGWKAAYAFQRAILEAYNQWSAQQDQKKKDQDNKRIDDQIQKEREAAAIGVESVADANAKIASLERQRTDQLTVELDKWKALAQKTLQFINESSAKALGAVNTVFAEVSTQLVKNFAATGDGFLKILGIAIGQIGALTAQAALQGENTAKAAARAAIDIAVATLEALVPVLSAKILGLSLATPEAVLDFGATAIVEWGALTAFLSATVAAAGAAAKSLLNLRTGISRVPGNPADGDAQPAMLQADERVVPREINLAYFPIYEALQRGGDIVGEVIRAIGPDRVAQHPLLNVMSDPYVVLLQRIGPQQLEQVARGIEFLEAARTNVASMRDVITERTLIREVHAAHEKSDRALEQIAAMQETLDDMTTLQDVKLSAISTHTRAANDLLTRIVHEVHERRVDRGDDLLG